MRDWLASEKKTRVKDIVSILIDVFVGEIVHEANCRSVEEFSLSVHDKTKHRTLLSRSVP
jgi:hypothetical protein